MGESTMLLAMITALDRKLKIKPREFLKEYTNLQANTKFQHELAMAGVEDMLKTEQKRRKSEKKTNKK